MDAIDTLLSKTKKPTAAPNSPCDTCGCPGRWIDLAGKPHCLACTPPPTRAFTRDVQYLWHDDHGQNPEWDEWPAPLPRCVAKLMPKVEFDAVQFD